MMLLENEKICDFWPNERLWKICERWTFINFHWTFMNVLKNWLHVSEVADVLSYLQNIDFYLGFCRSINFTSHIARSLAQYATLSLSKIIEKSLLEFFSVKASFENENINERLISIAIYDKLKHYLVENISIQQKKSTLVSS